MPSVKLDGEMFFTRAKKIKTHLGMPLLTVLGGRKDVIELGLNSAVFLYLLKYEFPETVLVVDSICSVVTSERKAEILKQIEGLNVVVRQKDGSNMADIRNLLGKGPYYVVDREGIVGDFCKHILEDISTMDATTMLKDLFLVKDSEEIEKCKISARATSALLFRGLEMVWDGTSNKEKFRGLLNEEIEGVDMSLLEFSFEPKETRTSINVGSRYAGYCTEMSRCTVEDMQGVYVARDYILDIIRPNVSSESVYMDAERFFSENNLSFDSDFIYTTGLMSRERSFKERFMLQKGVIFVINLKNSEVALSDTFLLGEEPERLTSLDTKLNITRRKSRFNNKMIVHDVNVRIREHQKELLDKLISERLEYYRSLDEATVKECENVKKSAVISYRKENLVPRQDRLVVDNSKEAIVIPIGSHAVPFHISRIKSVSKVDGSVLRINFITDVQERNEREDEVTEEKPGEGQGLSLIKLISIQNDDAKGISEEINNLRRAYLMKSEKEIVENLQEMKTKSKPRVLEDVYMKTDTKGGGRKKKRGSLELHENGFLFLEENTNIMFSDVKHIFFSEGNAEEDTILYFHLLNSIGKKTRNIQFYCETRSNIVYDTAKGGNERMDYIIEKEEENRRTATNNRFKNFCDMIESEAGLHVQIPWNGFHGTPFREKVLIKQTRECIFCVEGPPYFVLKLSEVEVVNFERVTFGLRTTDVVFVMKDKTHPVMSISNVDVRDVVKFKEYLDSRDVLFMETRINIQWNNLIKAIMKDPVSFYENGAWSELMIEDSEETSKDNTSEEDGSGVTTDDDDYEEDDDDDDDDDDEDDEDEDDDDDDEGDEDDEDDEEDDEEDDCDDEDEDDDDDEDDCDDEESETKKRKKN